MGESSAYRFSWGNLTEGDHLDEEGVDGKIILKWIKWLDMCT